MAVKSEISALRRRVDRIDERIIRLLNERAHLAQAIGRRKNVRRDAIYDPARERQVLDRVARRTSGPFPPEVVRNVFREIIAGSRMLEQRLRVAYLGPEATFTHQAAREQFGSGVAYVAVPSIPDVFTEVERGRVDFGVVPVENSTEGAVACTLDLLVESPASIRAEIQIPVQHFVLGLASDLARVRRVVSHPQALAQCRRWLATHCPRAVLEDVASTAQAAALVRSDRGTASIGGRAAAEHYGLRVLAGPIQDQPENITRFVVLGLHGDGRPTGDDKTSIVFSVRDEVGVLQRMLRPFAANGVNLTKIESRPLKGKPWQYLFFIDLRGHRRERRVRRAVDQLARGCLFVKVLGSYPAGRVRGGAR